MQNFTGFHKKSIAGFVCAFIFFISQFSFAIETLVPSGNQQASTQNIATQNTATQSTVTQVAATPTPDTATPAATAVPVNPAKPIVTPAKTNSASQLVSLIGGLALILALIYGLSLFVKRFSQGGFLHNPTMKIVSAMPLGTRERLMLVDIGGKQLLLGVTATQINTLHVFDEPVVQTEKSQAAASDFSQKLMAILQQKNVLSAESPAPKKSS